MCKDENKIFANKFCDYCGILLCVHLIQGNIYCQPFIGIVHCEDHVVFMDFKDNLEILL